MAAIVIGIVTKAFMVVSGKNVAGEWEEPLSPGFQVIKMGHQLAILEA